MAHSRLCIGVALFLAVLIPQSECSQATAQAGAPQASPAGPRDLYVTVGKSLVVESPVTIQRVSLANSIVAEAVAVSPREVLINGKAAGETSVVLWQQGGNRLLFDLHVRPSTLSLDAITQELRRELGPDVSISLQDGNVFLRGNVNDLTAAERAVAIAGTLGKPVNLLNVRVPPAEEQVLLKVRFANVDRAATSDLGVNIFSTGALNTPASITTGQFSPPQVTTPTGGNTQVTLTDALNIFLFRRDLNLGATIRALQNRRLLQILAEPNLLAMNNKQASFLAGGEFPVPVVQSGIGGAGAVTIQWREFGIRINFVPILTPRGTIRLQLAPEVSSLDFANALTISGFTVPAISTRRVQTEVELDDGQSFAIAGLLDNRVEEAFSKIPGIGNIPVLGKLFQSRTLAKRNTELLVICTPERVRPVPVGKPVPEIKYPEPFMKDAPRVAPQTPGPSVTGPLPPLQPQATIPVEQLQKQQAQPAGAPAQTPYQIIPVPVAPAQTPAQPTTPAPGTTPAPTAPRVTPQPGDRR